MKVNGRVGNPWSICPMRAETSLRLMDRMKLLDLVKCRYEAQRNSGQVQRFVRFCCYVPTLLQHFPFSALFQHI